MLRRRARLQSALAASALIVASTLVSAAPAVAAPDLDAYHGLGTWVDVFDYAPRLQSADATPRVTPESTADMKKLGVRTLYLQVANPDDAPSTSLADATTLKAILRSAHDEGLLVVAWFLPYVTDVAKDDEFIRSILRVRVNGRGFDGLALDIEDTQAVPDLKQRNNRVVELARRASKVLDGDLALGAIVYPAVQLEVVNPILWPSFPYRRLAPSIDVWMPMAYFTYRDVASGYRNAFTYSDESVTRLRARLGDDDAPVHLVGGIADEVTSTDVAGFLRAAKQTDAIGWSLYDYATTFSSTWPLLRRGTENS